jgi:hypothetical protein
MKIRVKNEQSKNYLQLSFVKIGGHSLNLWNRKMDSFISVNLLFEVIYFKSVWDTTDNSRRCKNGCLKRKISQPSAAALGFQSFALYRLMMVRGKIREFFCTDLLFFPSYLSVQIYCVFPATFVCSVIPQSVFPTYSIFTRILPLFNEGKPF